MRCALCGRETETTRHHLIPRRRHRGLLRKRQAVRDELNRTVELCVPCHSHIHMLFSERELEEEYRTVEALLENEDVRKFVAWMCRQDPGRRFGRSRRGRKGS